MLEKLALSVDEVMYSEHGCSGFSHLCIIILVLSL